MNKTKIKTFGVALIIAFQALITPVASANFLPVQAYGNDTVAGYASALRTSLINPGQNVVFVVEKPDMSVVRIPAQADLEGVAKTDLYGHQTKTSGDYRVAVVFPGSAESSPQNTFKVYPDQVSVTQSVMTSTSQMVTADGEDKTFVTVTLYDPYRNPIPNHQVQLISSREEDTVTVINNGASDENGRANFKITSKYSGISTFTAIDATVNKVLSDREEIVFFAPIKSESGFGGNILTANLFQADIGQSEIDSLPGPVDHFEITGLPSTVKVNTDQTITVTAKDKNNNVAKNYTGTILFSTPDDEHAVLPNNGEYTFKVNDQGKFTFNLALRFTQLGKQALQIFDKENWKISGEWEIEVVPEKAVITGPVSATLKIKSPIDGAELGNSLVVITGQGDYNINLKVFDNDTKIGNSETDSDGFFSYQAQNLQSGAHTFYVMSDVGDVSPSISIQIDTIPPVLNYFEIYPDGVVKPGTSLTVTAQSEPDLEEVKIRLQGVTEVLLPSDPGTYTATIAAPVTDGSFPVDVILIDKLANKAELLNKTVVEVLSPKAVPPPAVTSLEGEAGDTQVVLTWEEVADHETDIQNYKVYYGTDFNNLDQVTETDGAITTLTLEDLENDKQYFFFVKAVDSKGLESIESGTIIAVTPMVFTDEEDDEEEVGESEDGSVYPPMTMIPGGIQGVLNGNAITLTWQPFTGVQAYFYKIYFGLYPGQYDDYVVTPNNATTVTVRDLIPGLTYYFSVVALDLAGREISSLSEEFAMMPTGIGYYSASPLYPSAPTYIPPQTYPSPLDTSQFQKVPSTDKTGPEAVWLILISMIVGYSLYHHKRKILNN